MSKKELRLNSIYEGDSLEVLKTFPSECVDMIITSPPYWNLRQYAWTNIDKSLDPPCKHEKVNNVCVKCGAVYIPGMIGLETTIKEYVDKMVEIFTECRRVLTDYGTLWLNYGDTYSHTGGTREKDEKCGKFEQKKTVMGVYPKRNNANACGIKQKSMCMIPERVAMRLVDDGWVLRNKIIWLKPSIVPQSCKDRMTHNWEYIYFFTKKPRGYYFEQQFEECKSGTPQAENDRKRMLAGRTTYEKGKHKGSGLQTPFIAGSIIKGKPMRNKRAVWKISSQAVKEAHFATMPMKLLETPIKAGCPELVCTGKQSPVTKQITRPTEAFNIRIRDVKEGRDKHTDRIASDDEVADYDESEYKENKMKQEYTETLIDGCGQPVTKIFEKEYSPDKVDRAGKKALETRVNIGQRGDYTVEETQIDGCGKPVIPEIEKKTIKIGKVKETSKLHTNPNTNFQDGETFSGAISHLEVDRKPTTTATHCSCGSPFRKGIVLDPFGGSGTTAIVARALDRDYVLIELNPEYIKIAEKRLAEWDKERVLAKLNGEKIKTRLAKINRKGINGKKFVPNPLI